MIEHYEVALRLETGAPQMIGTGQTCLTGAYDDHLDLTQVVHVSTNRTVGVDLPGAAVLPGVMV
ncbi:hypothetical protein [Streptomyces sp. ME18-1-4]|uniref:hypothetical protein n=1 Tax=Streptomyces sp. ME18-1-4 TaxID=3028685 RepID=UPI0029A05A02|nr:hypothetical protein [Streptomyces sp. ME18-1-4]MDX3247822.1 hypothetical protein [Streptomyces sp. ME18-1-4]